MDDLFEEFRRHMTLGVTNLAVFLISAADELDLGSKPPQEIAAELRQGAQMMLDFVSETAA